MSDLRHTESDPGATNGPALLLDCSSSLFLAIVDAAGNPLAARTAAEERRSEAAHALLRECLGEAGLGPRDLAAILVAAGPGSFTGLRVGLALAQGLAFPRGLPVHAFPSARALSLVAPPDCDSLVTLIMAARDRFYLGRWPEGAEAMATRAEALAACARAAGLVLAGPMEGEAELRAAVPRSWRAEEAYPFAAVARMARGLPPAPGGVVQPHYVLRPAAQENLRRGLLGDVPVLAAGGRIRAMATEDMPAVVDIEAESAPDPWGPEQFRAYTVPGGSQRAWVYEPDHGAGPGAFLCAQAAADEFEIQNLAVAPDRRRRGVAGAMLSHALAWARAAGLARAFLEVRAGNHPARELYRKVGFIAAGMRKSYYSRPVEDALVLTLSLSEG